jgi:hypothetical protein
MMDDTIQDFATQFVPDEVFGSDRVMHERQIRREAGPPLRSLSA